MDNKFGPVLMLALIAIVVLAAVMLASSDPAGTALLQDQAGIVTAPAQVSASPLSGLWSLAARGMVVLAGAILISGLGWFAYQKAHQPSRSRWAGGPNARFARVPRTKPLTLKEMVEMQFYRTFLGEKPPQPPALPEERRKVEF